MLGSYCQFGAKFMHRHAHGSFPCLGADARALHATNYGGFGCTNNITIEAGHRKGLQDVKFDALIFERIIYCHDLFSYGSQCCFIGYWTEERSAAGQNQKHDPAQSPAENFVEIDMDP